MKINQFSPACLIVCLFKFVRKSDSITGDFFLYWWCISYSHSQIPTSAIFFTKPTESFEFDRNIHMVCLQNKMMKRLSIDGTITNNFDVIIIVLGILFVLHVYSGFIHSILIYNNNSKYRTPNIINYIAKMSTNLLWKLFF